MRRCSTFDAHALVARFDGNEDFARNLLEVALRTSAEAPAELRAACASADGRGSFGRPAERTAGGDRGVPCRRER